MALDKDAFLPERKVQNISKGLKSNGTSKRAGFYKEIDPRDLERTEDRACMPGALLFFLTFYTRERAFTRWVFFLGIQTLDQVLFA